MADRRNPEAPSAGWLEQPTKRYRDSIMLCSFRHYWRYCLLVLLAALTGCSGSALIDALTPGDTYRLNANLPYGANVRQQSDLYRPLGPAPPGGYPLVVFFYGGTWNSGQRADYRFVGEALAERGLMTLVADYRLYPEVSYPDFLDDCAAAVRYAFNQAAGWGANPQRIFLLGHSAGAYNVSMLALDQRWLAKQSLQPMQLAGWGGLAGPYDFLPIVNPEAKPVFHFPDTPVNSQPIRHVDHNTPPAFLAAARHDDLVDPQRNSAQLASALQARAVPVTLRLYDHVSHLTLLAAFSRPLRFLAPVLEDFTRFVAENGGAPSGIGAAVHSVNLQSGTTSALPAR